MVLILINHMNQLNSYFSNLEMTVRTQLHNNINALAPILCRHSHLLLTQEKNFYICIFKGWIDEYTLLTLLILGRSMKLQCSVKD